jgi:signal transduction histidine kinase
VVLLSQLALAAGVVYTGVYFTHRELRTAFDAALHERATAISALVRYPEAPGPDLVFERDLAPASINPHHQDMYEVRSSTGAIIARSANWSQEVVANPFKTFWNFRIAGKRYRAIRLQNVPILDSEGDRPGPPDTLTVVYAARSGGMHEEVLEAGISIGIASLALLLSTLALAIWQVRRGLVPLKQLATNASHVTPHNWEFKAPEDAVSTVELAPLAQSMTTMLEGLRTAFVQQREFLGNAAHELKTPVAILKSTMQSLLQRPRSPEEYRARIEESLDDVERLEKLLQSMLRLARAEQWAAGGLHRDLDSVDIATTCATAIDRLRGLIHERPTQMQLQTNGPVCVRADAEDLELIWVNLLENAIRYSPEGSTVRISAVASDGNAVVRIEDQGVGISAEELAHVFERFHRGDASRARETGGFGLGLAISKALTEAYGGTISAQSRVGQGTCITVQLPLN